MKFLFTITVAVVLFGCVESIGHPGQESCGRECKDGTCRPKACTHEDLGLPENFRSGSHVVELNEDLQTTFRRLEDRQKDLVEGTNTLLQEVQLMQKAMEAHIKTNREFIKRNWAANRVNSQNLAAITEWLKVNEIYKDTGRDDNDRMYYAPDEFEFDAADMSDRPSDIDYDLTCTDPTCLLGDADEQMIEAYTQQCQMQYDHWDRKSKEQGADYEFSQDESCVLKEAYSRNYGVYGRDGAVEQTTGCSTFLRTTGMTDSTLDSVITCKPGFDENSVISKGARWCLNALGQYDADCGSNGGSMTGIDRRIKAHWTDGHGGFYLGSLGNALGPNTNYESTCTKFFGPGPVGKDLGTDHLGKDKTFSDETLKELAECIVLDMAKDCTPKCTAPDKATEKLTWHELTQYFCVPTAARNRSKDGVNSLINEPAVPGCGEEWYELITEWSNAHLLHTGLDLFENEIHKVLQVLEPRQGGNDTFQSIAFKNDIKMLLHHLANDAGAGREFFACLMRHRNFAGDSDCYDEQVDALLKR